MCFSTTASFASCAVLATIGTATMARTTTNRQRLLGAMPLLFAYQQFSEGFVWLSVQHAGFAHLRNIAMYSFLIFAQIVWPLFVPFAVLVLEKDAKRKKLLKWFAFAGCLAATYFTWCICFYSADVEVSQYHIKYVLDFPLSKRWFYGIIYFIPAMLPTFFSGFSRMRFLGFLLFASYIVSRFCYKDYIVSVWCFFGALSSITVLYIIMQVVGTEKKNAGAPMAA